MGPIDLPDEYPKQEVADHEVLIAFNGDADAMQFREWWREYGEEVFRRMTRAKRQAEECPGHARGGTAPACCDRAGEYNGFGSDGPRRFTCPKGCSCHD